MTKKTPVATRAAMFRSQFEDAVTKITDLMTDMHKFGLVVNFNIGPDPQDESKFVLQGLRITRTEEF